MNKLIVILLLVFLFFSCNEQKIEEKIEIKNTIGNKKQIKVLFYDYKSNSFHTENCPLLDIKIKEDLWDYKIKDIADCMVGRYINIDNEGQLLSSLDFQTKICSGCIGRNMYNNINDRIKSQIKKDSNLHTPLPLDE